MKYKTPAPEMCLERIEEIIRQNVKRTHAGCVRNFVNFGRNQKPTVMSESEIYDLPSKEDLHNVIESNKYCFYLFRCISGF